MKKLFSILLLAIICFQSNGNESDSYGTLIIFRDFQLQAYKFYYPVELNGEKITYARTGTYFVKNLQPGTYRVSAKTEAESFANVTILPNDTVYVRCGVNMGFWVARPDIIQVDKSMGSFILSTGKLTNITDEVFSELKPKGSVGISFGGTGGFESVNLFEMEDGKYSRLNPGGGFNIGINFSHILLKKFEVFYEIRYQGASLTPMLSNASAHFGRGIASASMYYIIPLKSNYLQLKLGGGAGYHFGTNLEIDSKKVDGNLFTAKYDPTIGYRIGGTFGTYINRFGFTFGLHYNMVSYTLNELRVNGVLSEFSDENNLLNRPNGKGIEFSAGYHFIF